MNSRYSGINPASFPLYSRIAKIRQTYTIMAQEQLLELTHPSFYKKKKEVEITAQTLYNRKSAKSNKKMQIKLALGVAFLYNE
jgi:hypothetical protein